MHLLTVLLPVVARRAGTYSAGCAKLYDEMSWGVGIGKGREGRAALCVDKSFL